MGVNDYLLILVVVFFGLVIYLINSDEKREAERRQQNLPHPVERRKRDRRKEGLLTYLAWFVRSQGAKLRK